jgi:large subunit ribosomal protein L32e
MKERNESSEEIKALLELRRKIAEKRPEFVRQESWRYKRVKPSWRRPKGIDSKMRLEVKGWPKRVKVGYRGPRKVRGLHPTGYKEVMVYNPKDLEKINPETEVARIGHAVGAKTRREIVAKAKKLGIKVLNPTRVRKR